jgi:hypothetical protein
MTTKTKKFHAAPSSATQPLRQAVLRECAHQRTVSIYKGSVILDPCPYCAAALHR